LVNTDDGKTGECIEESASLLATETNAVGQILTGEVKERRREVVVRGVERKVSADSEGVLLPWGETIIEIAFVLAEFLEVGPAGGFKHGARFAFVLIGRVTEDRLMAEVELHRELPHTLGRECAKEEGNPLGNEIVSPVPDRREAAFNESVVEPGHTRSVPLLEGALCIKGGDCAINATRVIEGCRRA
jgi:hypothetical protein